MAKLTGLRAKFKPADTSKHHIPTFVVMTCLYIALGLLRLACTAGKLFRDI